MNIANEYPQDEKTVLLDHEGRGPARGAVTDFPSPPRFEQLEDRMIYTARLQGAMTYAIGPNVLVDAAWDLLLQAVRLKVSPDRETVHALNDRLAQAITAFETHATHLGADNSQVMSARYILCSVIDEAVTTTTWGSRSEWSKTSLLSRFHNETFGGEKFFQMLDRMSRDPVKHVAMLELLYLSLALGFEGKYRVMERGAAQLETLRDALFRQIKHVRGDRPAITAPPLTTGPLGQPRMPAVSIAWISALTLTCLLAIYSGFAWVLGNERVTALQPFQSLAPDQNRSLL